MAKKKNQNKVKRSSSIEGFIKKFFALFAIAFVLTGGVLLFVNRPEENVLGASITPTPSVCQKVNPSISVFPSSASVKAGTIVIYFVKVTNKDRGNCVKRTFNLTQALPSSKWSGTFDSSKFILLPGRVRSVVFKLKSPSNISSRSYTASVKLNTQSTPTKTVGVTYGVKSK